MHVQAAPLNLDTAVSSASETAKHRHTAVFLTITPLSLPQHAHDGQIQHLRAFRHNIATAPQLKILSDGPNSREWSPYPPYVACRVVNRT